MKKTAVITGATSGIGLATARKLASMGYRLILTGRRKERLENLGKEILERYSCESISLVFDIQDTKATEKAIGSIPELWRNIDVLINNAGLASGFSPFHESRWDQWETMIDTNIKGLLYISKLIVSEMIQRKSGQVINLSSIAGINVYENGNVYCATKSAVNAITQAMRIDLLKYGIKVSSIAPGAVETEFSLVRFEGDQARANQVYRGLNALKAEDVADCIEFILTRPPHVNINDMLVMPTQQANSYYQYRVTE